MLLSQRMREKRYAKFTKRTHDELRKYPSDQLAANIVSRLHRQRGRDVEEWRSQPPWILLLLLKWAIMYGYRGRLVVRRVTDGDVDRLVNQLQDINGRSVSPTEYDNIWLFLRAIAYQQFSHQDPLTLAAIARQSFLFRGLSTDHRFRTSFRAAKDIDLDDWIDLSFMLAAAFLSSTPRVAVRDSYFESVRHRYSAAVTSKFLGSYARSLPELREFLINTTMHKPLELVDRSPFLTFPLLRRADDFLCFSPQLLLKSIEDRVYDTLRGIDSERFMDIFGALFETYVRRGLDFLGQDYVSEDKLKVAFGSGKVTDFALFQPDNVTFIDAKGVDVGLQGMASSNATTVKNRTRTSIVKALLQGDEFGRRVLASNGARELFLLVVTYKPLYFGNGAGFVRAIGPTLLAQEGYDPDRSVLRPENVYFASVDEFEYLVSALRQSGLRMADYLARLRGFDSDPKTQAMMMKQHLFKHHSSPELPTYLEEEWDATMKRMSAALGVGV